MELAAHYPLTFITG